MKIKDIQKAAATLRKSEPVHDRKGEVRSSLEFQRQMSTLHSDQYEQHIRELTEKICKQGEIVARKADIAAYQKYRELITELIHETVSNSYVFYKTEKIDVRGRHKVVAIIRRVNQRLDELAAEILKGESENIKLLQTIDDIRGMLVDLFL